MIYDGTLTMPANFAALDEEEMTYVDGGLMLDGVTVASKDIASSHCSDWATEVFYVQIGTVCLGAVIGLALGAEAAGEKGAIAGAMLGAMFGLVGDSIFNQWREAYAQAARDARKLSWNGWVSIRRELIGGVMFVDFFRPPYVGA